MMHIVSGDPKAMVQDEIDQSSLHVFCNMSVPIDCGTDMNSEANLEWPMHNMK